MQTDKEPNVLIASALTGVVKQIKAIRYYPPKHPALQAAAEECLRGFAPVLSAGKHLQLTVRKEGFLVDDSPVAKSNEVLAQLASFCFARRIQHLTFLADLKSSDLYYFVHYLLLDPLLIQKKGGMQALLEKSRLTTIWANIRDLDDILERRQEIEALPEDPDFDPAAILSEDAEDDEDQAQADAIDLATLLDKLEKEQEDERFQHYLQELIPLLRLQLSEERRPLVLRAFLLLCRTATGKRFSADRRQHARLALGQLSSEEMIDYLVDYVFATGTQQKTRDLLAKILAFLSDKAAGRLMQILAIEESAPKRKFLCEILGRCGPAILPLIKEYLSDERWYVVRNAVAILGDIRSQDSLAELAQLLRHDEIRVRREIIRALSKISGKQSVKILLQTAVSGDQEIRRQAILSLGAMRANAAVPTLLALLKERGWSQREIDLKKDVIRSLGEIRSEEATPELIRILKKKRLLHRQLNNELRAAAAAALGDVADEIALGVLNKASNDRNSAVARAAAQALKQLDRAKQ